ncbi:MAG: hypothetical protein IE931_03375 [Sphingobacteriales bacterium]|nr:hypothetical protein [Sphingobacteriales bacterium]
MNLVDGNYLNQYVAPKLLEDFRNYKNDFIGVIPRAPQEALTADGIKFNKLINNVGFLINNVDPFAATVMAGKKGIIEWDKLDTTPTKVTDAEIRYLPFDKRSTVRVKHTESWIVGYRDYVLNKIAPYEAATGMIVLRTTGAADANGRKRLTYNDLIDFESQINLLNLMNPDKLFLTLCSQHQNDLKLDKAGTQNNRDFIRMDKDSGAITGFLKLKIFENNAAPIYTAAGVLKAQGAAPAVGDQAASVFFYGDSMVQHVESVKILYKPETIDTTNADPTSEFRLQSYALCEKTQDYGFGALISENA